MTRPLVIALAVVSTSVHIPALAQAQAQAGRGRAAGANQQTAPMGRVISRAPAQGQARIEGVVVTRDEPPKAVKRATVRARTADGRTVGTVTTDDSGRFFFELDRPGSYYVELVDDAGRVLAVEDVGQVPIVVGPGQVSTTLLRVPTRLAAAAWGTTAKTILGAAGAAGVGALVAGGQPASPER